MPFEHPGHLPNHRDGKPLEPERLPRQRRGTTPQMHGRYPDHDVLALAGHWDAETRDVVLRRLDPPAYRFFDPGRCGRWRRSATWSPGRTASPASRCFASSTTASTAGAAGFRYEGMPDDGEAWRRVASGLDDAAGGSFAELDEDARCELVARFAKHDLHGGVWDTMPIERAWGVVTAAIVTAFYAHPWAWNEIGFGGPAYPRGYMRLGVDQHEPWEGLEAEGVGRRSGRT